MNVLLKNGDMLYTKLKHQEKALKELETLGVVATHWRRDIRIFESFHALPETLCVYCKYEMIAEEEGISSDSVKRIVLKMSND